MRFWGWWGISVRGEKVDAQDTARCSSRVRREDTRDRSLGRVPCSDLHSRRFERDDGKTRAAVTQLPPPEEHLLHVPRQLVQLRQVRHGVDVIQTHVVELASLLGGQTRGGWICHYFAPRTVPISSGKKSPSDSTEADFSPRRFQSVYGDGRLAQRTTGTRSNAECRANEPRVVVWDRTRARSWVDAKVKQFN